MSERSALRTIVTDVIGLAGMGAISFGSFEIYAPLGILVAGVFAVAIALLLSRST
jgi:hypothetical protein